MALASEEWKLLEQPSRFSTWLRDICQYSRRAITIVLGTETLIPLAGRIALKGAPSAQATPLLL
jgi:hypothetical protein